MKLRHLAVLLGAMVAFTGCSSKEATTPVEPTTQEQTKEEPKQETTENAEAFTGTQTREALYELGKGDVIVTEMTFENGTPVDVKMDVRMENGQMKSEAAASGEYVMVEGGTPWNEQIDALVAFIKENNFDLSKVTYTNDKGNTDVVSGVSIKVSAYVEAVEALMTEVANGQVAEGFTGAKVGEVKGEKDTTTAKVMFEHGVPVNVKFDIAMEDGKSKYKEAKDGNYSMGEGTTPWNEQVDALAAFLVENNFDIAKVTLTNEAGNTDVVSGVSIKVPDLLKAVEEALK
ncbi:MAG: hypothetical protein ACRC1P_00050 [Cellulosilyticaceae bacterium]